MYPMDAQVVGKDHVLIVEYHGSKLTERDFKGNIIWQKQVNNPCGVQRLPNGNTLIVTRTEMLEIDRNQKEIFHYNNRLDGEIAHAQKLRNGQYGVITASGSYVRLDRTGKELRNIRVQPMNYYGGAADVLPGDRVVIPTQQGNKVVEYNSSGKIVWEVNAQYPTSASRLPNGNTLVACIGNSHVVEYNRAGKVVWEYSQNIRPSRARRR